jgi:hypothetical protein
MIGDVSRQSGDVLDGMDDLVDGLDVPCYHPPGSSFLIFRRSVA